MVLPLGGQPFFCPGLEAVYLESPHIFQDPTNTTYPFSYITRLGEPRGKTPGDGKLSPVRPSLFSDKKAEALPHLTLFPPVNGTLVCAGHSWEIYTCHRSSVTCGSLSLGICKEAGGADAWASTCSVLSDYDIPSDHNIYWQLKETFDTLVGFQEVCR